MFHDNNEDEEKARAVSQDLPGPSPGAQAADVFPCPAGARGTPSLTGCRATGKRASPVKVSECSGPCGCQRLLESSPSAHRAFEKSRSQTERETEPGTEITKSSRRELRSGADNPSEK